MSSTVIAPSVGLAASIFPCLQDGTLLPTHVLLIRRAKSPGLGKICFPGGRQEPGETLAAGTAREAVEETGLNVTVLDPVFPAFTATDVIIKDEDRVTYHFGIVHVATAVPVTEEVGADGETRLILPTPIAADDAYDAAWYPVHDLPAKTDAQAGQITQTRSSVECPYSRAAAMVTGAAVRHESLVELDQRGEVVPFVLDVIRLGVHTCKTRFKGYRFDAARGQQALDAHHRRMQIVEDGLRQRGQASGAGLEAGPPGQASASGEAGAAGRAGAALR